jgi:hypothetical protein
MRLAVFVFKTSFVKLTTGVSGIDPPQKESEVKIGKVVFGLESEGVPVMPEGFRLDVAQPSPVIPAEKCSNPTCVEGRVPVEDCKEPHTEPCPDCAPQPPKVEGPITEEDRRRFKIGNFFMGDCDLLWKEVQASAEGVVSCGAYRDLWNEINGPQTFQLNPWVWVIAFKRIRP